MCRCSAYAWALTGYFRDPRAKRKILLAPAGTLFQQRVWRALRRIPSGQVRSYGQLARTLGTSARAVGGACRANPIPVLIPCHRVVAATGEGGFMGKTAGRAMTIKRWLLHHEQTSLIQRGHQGVYLSSSALPMPSGRKRA